jgi:hypothetical protein
MPPLRRRDALPVAASFLAGCTLPSGASAQPRPAVVHALPLPCAAGAGDIASVLLDGSGSPEGTVAVFGQVFRQGDLPRGATLAARTADGSLLPAQLDISVRHPDGSVRFGLVSLALPALPRGRVLGAVLARGTQAPGPPLDLVAATRSRRALVTIAPAAGGAPWEADLLAPLRAAPAPQDVWQAGPLAAQRRVTLAVPPGAIGGATSMRLVADVALRADGMLVVDLWLRNDIAMRPGGGGAAYSLRVMLDGREVLRANDVRHAQYQAWGRVMAVGPDGRAATPAPVLRANAAYMAESGAIARYDLSTGIDAEQLGDLARQMADPAWAAPFARRGITTYMPTAGGRGDIGPTTAWQAAALISGDPRATGFALGQAETAGAVPWHMWDPRGGWMEETRWPEFWFDVRNGPPPRSLLQPVDLEASGWHPIASHQPDLAFVPYLLTGRRALLDELQAQAAWNVLSVWPLPRREAGAARGVNLVHGREIRAMAWSMRQLNEAAWISPDNDPQHAYFGSVVQRNWAWARSRLAAWTEMQGEAHGWIPPDQFGPQGLLAPWQQDHFATSAAAAARHGNADARAVLAWMANFLVGRFRAADRGFPRNDGAVPYIVIATPGRPPSDPHKTWSAIGAATREAGLSNGTGWSRTGGDYGRLALQSLALLQDVLGHSGAREAYVSLTSSNPPPFSDLATQAREPVNNITPRDLPRVPGRAPRCAPAGR